MCVDCGCGVDANGNETAVTVKATIRVAEGQGADIFKGFDVPPPYGKGK